MFRFTYEQRLEIFKNYYRSSDSVVATLKALTPILGLNNRTIQQAKRAIVDKFGCKFSLSDVPAPKRRRTARSDETIAANISTTMATLSPPILPNATVVDRIVYTLLDHKDWRTRNWFLSDSPWALFSILGVYLFFCLYAGPRYMRNRKPFELKKALMFYNAAQVVLSVVLCHETYKGGWDGHYDYRCAPLRYDTDPVSMRMANAVWLYYMAKISELLDTVFFVLRKNERQISFLHLYHHTSMPLAAVVGVKSYAAGHGTMIILLNSFIHVIMYSYYLLSAMGPKVQKYLWWKKYITLLQILQFLIVFIHTIQIQFRTNCNYPKFFAGLLSINSCFFVFMFTSFYIRSYKKEKKQAAARVSKLE